MTVLIHHPQQRPGAKAALIEVLGHCCAGRQVLFQFAWWESFEEILTAAGNGCAKGGRCERNTSCGAVSARTYAGGPSSVIPARVISMPRYGALFAPWPWTPDGYTGMTYMERERVDKVRQGLRTVFDEGSAYVVEQAVREELHGWEIRGLVNLLLVGMTLDTGADLVDGDAHRAALLDDHSFDRSKGRRVVYKSPPAVPRRYAGKATRSSASCKSPPCSRAGASSSSASHTLVGADVASAVAGSVDQASEGEMNGDVS